MLDIGWPELLVVAIVLIVVVGPKDLPPMLRAFGKMTSRLRKTAGEFRSQFDEALREAELDDVRQTISDARKLNPMNSVREALSPLRQAGNEIKSDLQNAVKADPVKGPVETPDADKELKVAEPAAKLPAEPPVLKDEADKSETVKPKTAKVPARKAAPKVAADKKPEASKSKPEAAVTPAEKASKPAAKPSTTKRGKTVATKKDPAAAKPSTTKASTAASKATAKKTAARKPAATKKTGDA
ncbi:Sec-independent protein translocase protein TatB [Rhizobium sp. L1K21]|uniref:Sec-independent protein translocase protein TatB n=1 Tax=Rhizobium sp. L1K21 TaxID=2954933 RepID=UPI002092ABD4|nr:Sec-independent protein translocase protein TatB [Rhizobium sp. L1K21]MCO6186151.1 Sec-independent protein translocase protein TatB [Rhizobium sp. L1K21]